VGGKPLSKQIKNSIIYGGAFCAYTIARSVPRKIGLKIFGAIGAIAFVFPNEEKNRTIKHLRKIFGNTWSDSKIKKTAREVYIQLGKNLFDGVYLSGLTKCKFDKIVKHDSFDEFREAYNQGKGIVAITAHTGCFEMLLHYFAIAGFKCFAIGRRMYDDRLEQLIRQNRSGENITYMNRTEGPRKMIRELQEGKVFGVLIDQDTDVEGVFVDFLGNRALTPSGPVKIAMKLNIPVFVVTTARQQDDSHYIYVNKRLPLVDTKNFDEDLKRNVQLANDQICETIRQFPSQWVWMHRRWKRQP
jgi:Kdo2-lipid IVA lauroyltransferase/acyltransferase